MLTDRDLERGRADIAETMMDTAVIWRSTLANNSSGEASVTFAPVGTVSARIDPERSPTGDQMYAEREGGLATFRLTVPYNTSLLMGDQVVIGAEMYELKEVHDTHSDRMVVRAICTKVSD